jgi:multidrug transporter EmrE-like cation transporter
MTYSTAASIFAAGAFFMLANLAMKVLGHMPAYILYPVVAMAMVGGCYFEILALKGVQFAFAIVVILGLEMLLSVMIAHAFLGERYSLTNLAGVVLVVSGIGLVHLPSGKAEAETIETTGKNEPIAQGELALSRSSDPRR